MNYPKEVNLVNELELKLGIKSSLPNPKEMLGLLFLIWSVRKKSKVDYSIQVGDRIELEPGLLKDIVNTYKVKFDRIGLESEIIKTQINKNPLLESQMEALIVALELIWRIGKVEFIEEKADSSERTGGVRYEKSIIFTKNIDLLDLFINDEVIDVFIAWTFGKPIKKEKEEKLVKFLTIISEEAMYRIYIPEGKVDFRQNEIYEGISSNGSVNINSEKEAKGAFRILKSLLKKDLNYLLKIDGSEVSPKKDVSEIEEYHARVEAYLNLVNYKVEFVEKDDIKDKDIEEKDVALISKVPSEPHNRILYGAPGTGKSHTLEEDLDGYSKEQIERVTFYGDYTYGKFVGMFKPTSDGEYAYQEGPFLRILKKALDNEDKKIPFFLIVEEINRTDAATTFGDIFQLLDRDESGKSTYEIDASEDMKIFFDKTKIKDGKIYIPENLYIWSTMNSADQGVYPLDSAFKRRWSMEYVDIDKGEDIRKNEEIVFEFKEGLKSGDKYSLNWNNFRKAINEIIGEKGIREDKQLAVFFLKKEELNQKGFINKLLMYLSEDVFRHNKSALFKFNTYGKIIKNFKNGEEIFLSDNINDLFKKV